MRCSASGFVKVHVVSKAARQCEGEREMLISWVMGTGPTWRNKLVNRKVAWNQHKRGWKKLDGSSTELVKWEIGKRVGRWGWTQLDW